MKRVEVLAVASEFYPLVKTGGLADVCGALPAALAANGVRVRTLLPGYPAVVDHLRRMETAHDFGHLFGGPARLLAVKRAGGDLLVLDAPHLYARPGGPYGDQHGVDWPDNPQRFAALARVAADIGLGLLPRYAPGVIHAHDWQAGLTAAYLHFDGRPRPGTVMTVHNLAFQGQFDRRLLGELGLPPEAFTPDAVEYYGDIGFLKAGLRLSDRITTVSPTYAAEICTPEGGMGLDGLLRGRADRLTGILNGIDDTIWDPAKDPLIAAPYDIDTLSARESNRADLRRRFGLDPDPHAPLFALVTRLSWQKGIDLLLAAMPTLLAIGGQLAVLGSGDPHLVAALQDAVAGNPGRVGCLIGYDEALAHAVQAGTDVLMVPSRFEPCGLTQLCALRYGAAPLVARVGGLADTIIDAGPMARAAGAGTGLQFAPVNAPMLENAIRRAGELFRDRPAWRRLQANGMATDVSWREPARLYAALYRDVIGAGGR